MDIQRNLLIVALVLVSGMLLTEWVKFRDTHVTQAAAVQEATQSAAAPAVPVTGGALLPTLALARTFDSDMTLLLA